ncbi:hypothetical protein NC653_031473 [Populus alba x Populus x berolinensis]|uniref:Uncharacterized protein n=1 Tax=Populus alba x Populus x berolinensis TaxID=444605 RepID=A0AAD6Q1E7_9ROSI|nr:hypothetical protein NC653_031473 [Populus alba x Populus x berolinensis]
MISMDLGGKDKRKGVKIIEIESLKPKERKKNLEKNLLKGLFKSILDVLGERSPIYPISRDKLKGTVDAHHAAHHSRR